MVVSDGELPNSGIRIIPKCLLPKERQGIIPTEQKQDGVLCKGHCQAMMLVELLCYPFLLIIIILSHCVSGIRMPIMVAAMCLPILRRQKTRIGYWYREKNMF